MGEYTNTLWQNIITSIIVVVIVVLSTLYGISTLFPNMLK
jgi:Mn2+/Fe2+ NRAMP family transporter